MPEVYQSKSLNSEKTQEESLIYLGVANSSKREVCSHTTRQCGQKARNYIALVKFMFFFISGDTMEIKNNKKLLITVTFSVLNHFLEVNTLPSLVDITLGKV